MRSSEVANFLKPCPCCGNQMPTYSWETEPATYEGIEYERVSVRIRCKCGLQTIPFLVERRPQPGAGDPGSIAQLPVAAAMNLAVIWNARA